MTVQQAAADLLPISDPVALRQYYENQAAGIITIKPKVLFQKIEAGNAGPVPMKINVPSSGIGSVTLLEATALVSIVKLIQPARIFEFGTFLGYSTALLVENSDAACAIYSLDLGESHAGGKALDSYADADLRRDATINDAYLRDVQRAGTPRYLGGLADADAARLTLLKQDSRQFDPAAHGLVGTVDLVFVDGGHDIGTVAIDTANARTMLGDSGVIVWHDFNSAIHGDVTTFVNALAAAEPVLHIQHTMMAMLLVGDIGREFLRIGVESSAGEAA
ncbi:class I SAM-dependent methyltransferase [uncultured Sphingomonas sp.]|uniref:class I SAM-dependent methyltransferase n=1 Tax=uncultured Sphingomonas sp. TaxID=158754 RepID=UPI0025DBE94E|nr:class I SAM-dependent methyltransferase [uncultured Sphingomonas sp.]